MKGENDMLFGLFKNNDDERVAELEEENEALHNRIDELKDLCEEKDSYFTEMISDGLRHGSKLAAKHMSDRKKYLNGEYDDE